MPFRDTPKITRADLYGAQKPAKTKRQGTRSPLKDLAAVTVQASLTTSTDASGFVLTIPLRLVSELNTWDSWPIRLKRQKNQQNAVKLAWIALKADKALPKAGEYFIKFTRIGMKKLDPDAISSCFKHAQDAVCALIGIDDGSDRLSFEYCQEVTGKREYAVRIEIREKR